MPFKDVQETAHELEYMGTRYGEASTPPEDPQDLTVEIKEVDGLVFRSMMTAGYKHLSENKDELNKINVFPIPDADTGNNMKLALRSGVLNQLYEPTAHLQEAVARFAEDALLAGQGNSGTVLSHFFSTLSAELSAGGGASKIPVAKFAEALEKCGATVHAAFPADKVKEGTIVSVVRKSTVLSAGGFNTLREMTEVWESQAKVALYETPDELEVDGVYVLKEARAKDPSIDSDSGAKGFYYIVEGILNATNKQISLDGVAGKGAIRRITESEFSAAAEVFDGTEKHQYCTECVIKLKEGVSKDAIEAKLSDPAFGDSMVVVSSPAADGMSTLAKVHIHSDEPQKVFDALTDEFSATKIPIKVKADDMRRQVEDSKLHYDPETFKVTLLLDSTAQVGPWAANSYVHVPIVCTIRGEPHSCSIDPPTANVLEFLNKTRHEEIPCGTAAPPVLAWKKIFDSALKNSDKPVLAVTVNKHMSVTHANALQAREQLSEEDQKRVTVVDHGYMFGPCVAIACSLLKAAAKGYSLEQLLQIFEEVRSRGYYNVFQNTTSVMRLVKHGRVPKEVGEKIGKLPDDMFCMVLGTSPADGPPPVDYVACAGSLKNKVLEPIAGPGAKEKGYRAALEKIRDSLKEGEVVRDFTYSEVCREDLSNHILKLAEEILGDKLVKPVHLWHPFLAIAAVSAWGSASFSYWIDDGKTSVPV